MGNLTEEVAKSKVSEFNAVGDLAVLPYKGKFGIFVGSFKTEQEARAKLEEIRGEGWLTEDVVQPGATAAVPAPTLEMATPASAQPTPNFGATGPANAAGGSTSGAKSGAGAASYRVDAGPVPDNAAAQAMKADLENSKGVFPVEVVPGQGGTFHVYLGFSAATREDAERDAANLRRDLPGMALAVVEAGELPATDATTIANISGGATAEEINYLRDLQSKAEGGRTGRVDADEANRAMEALRNLDAKQQEIVRQFAQQRAREADAVRFMQDIRRSANDGDIATAEATLQRWRQSDPNNPSISLAQDWLEARKRASTTGSSANNAALLGLIDQAEKAQVAGEPEKALELWQQVRRTAVDDATKSRAATQITVLTGQLSRTVMAPKPVGSTGISSSKLMMYIGIGVGVLVVVGVIVVLLKKKKAPALQPSSMMRPGMMTTPLPLSRSGTLSTMQGVKHDSKSAPHFTSQSGVQRLPARDKPTNPRPSGEVSRPSSAETARMSASNAPAPNAAQPVDASPDANGAQAAEPILTSSVDLGNLVLPEIFDEPAEPPAKAAPAAAKAPAPEQKPLPDDGDIANASTVIMQGTTPLPVSSQPKATQPKVEELISSIPIKKTPLPVAGGIGATTPAPVSAPAKILYAQNFDDEELGGMPRGWKGSYDYATLSVVDRENGGKCMKFEKGKGTGSAYFSCRFPDAAGRVVVEFDLRCDHKNKYLLGFYVEMDEDFRHSVHTVVHMDATKADKVSLRLQNETAPYKLGEWTRMRYLIDLPRNMVDGFVDDKPVAVGVRLPSRPKVVNTLSIRDNLATEGILLIDNIRIYKDRA
ncbi:hypothetical protein IT570_10225 [Candidatus Sumerlaeota bacterium]|nr:hypothetical protein [Candidatus Sumerlaeota bacterium]